MSNTASVSRLNLKTVLIISLLLITLIPFSVNTPRVEATGESWLDGWTYRKEITISGSTAGAQTDYQIRIRVNSINGTDSGEYVYLNGSSRDDFGDIRFTASDGSTLLDYWNESVKTNEAFLTNFTRSGSNPLIDFDGGDGYWLTGFYNNYDGKIYLLIQEGWSPSVVVTCWSFDLAEWENVTAWTDHGTVLTGTELWEDFHVEPHGVVWETQTMADVREGVGEGLGTRQWRLYYCGSATGTSDYSVGYANASKENPTVWTKYAGNPIYGHGNAVYHTGVSIADPEAFLFNGELWMAVGKYVAGSCTDQWFAYSENGTDGWTDTTANLLTPNPVWGTCFEMEDVISWVGRNPPDAIFSLDGETVTYYSGNPVLPLGVGGQWDDTDIGMSTLIKDNDESYFIGGTAYLYYFGNRGVGTTQFGVATSTTERYERQGIFWVEVDAIPASPDNGTIYMYYGKADATSTNDGYATFVDFDDFNNNSLNAGWTEEKASGAETIVEENQEIHFHHRMNTYAHIEKSMTTDNVVTRVQLKRVDATVESSWGIGLVVYFNQYDFASIKLRDDVLRRRVFTHYVKDEVGDSTNGAENTWILDTYKYVRVRVNASTVYFDYSDDGLSWTNLDSTARPPTWDTPSLIIIGHGFEANSGSYPNADFDNSAAPSTEFESYADEYLVRKYAISEPYIVEWGIEESYSPPSPNNNPSVTSFIISDLSDGDTVFKTLWYRPVMVVDDSDGLSEIGTSYFAFETDYGWHNVSYNYQTDVYAVPVGGGRIIIANGYTESSGTSLTIHFYLMCLEPIDVKNNVDVYCRVTDISSGDSDWSLEQLDYFNILDYVEDIGGSSGWTPDETPSEEPQEIWIDSDEDGIPNWDDPDVDGDWVPNEYDPDIDGDGIPNELDPDPFIPEEKEERPILLSFKTPSGKIINIINPLYYLKPYQKIIVPFIFLLLAIILISMYAKREEEKANKGKIAPQIRTGGYGKLEELKKRR